MTVPSPRRPGVAAMLERLSGRSTAIKADVCLDPPYGCGMSVTGGFRDDTSLAEYADTGLCQDCQDLDWVWPEKGG